MTNVSDVTVTYLLHRKLYKLQLQTELTCQRIQEFETQASSDLELRNSKIEELNRVSVMARSRVWVKLCPVKVQKFSRVSTKDLCDSEAYLKCASSRRHDSNLRYHALRTTGAPFFVADNGRT